MSHYTTTDVHAWAGPARDQITDDDATTIATLWGAAHDIYCADDSDPDALGMRAASTGAAAYVLGDTTLAQAASEWEQARAAELAAKDTLIGVILASLDAGATRSGICDTLGIARTTLNRWLEPRR